jgi:hypothetical protein
MDIFWNAPSVHEGESKGRSDCDHRALLERPRVECSMISKTLSRYFAMRFHGSVIGSLLAWSRLLS